MGYMPQGGGASPEILAHRTSLLTGIARFPLCLGQTDKQHKNMGSSKLLKTDIQGRQSSQTSAVMSPQKSLFAPGVSASA